MAKTAEKTDVQAPKMDNMFIWNQTEQTDPDFTDKVNFGSFKFTSIDAMYQIKRATQVLGPCGIGWGIRSQHFEMLTVDPADAHYNLMLYTAQLWYNIDGQEGSLDIAADIELFENTKNGWKRVSDPMKKVRTDALTKGLSWLGFSADVFMGRFDDQKYVQKLQQEKRAELMRKERAGKGQNVELATEQQLSRIQLLAGRAGLAGADFASWLRETHNTSWSRITITIADKVLSSLQALLGEQQDAAYSRQASSDDLADAVSQEPEIETQPTTQEPATEEKTQSTSAATVRRTLSDFMADVPEALADDLRAKLQADKHLSAKVDLTEDCRLLAEELIGQTPQAEKKAMHNQVVKNFQNLLSRDTLPKQATELIGLTPRQLQTLKGVLSNLLTNEQNRQTSKELHTAA